MNLKTIRHEKKLTGAEVSAQAGISQQHYSWIETGKRRPSVEVAKRIAAVLSFPWTRFYEEEDGGGAAGASGRADAENKEAST